MPQKHLVTETAERKKTHPFKEVCRELLVIDESQNSWLRDIQEVFFGHLPRCIYGGRKRNTDPRFVH